MPYLMFVYLPDEQDIVRRPSLHEVGKTKKSLGINKSLNKCKLPWDTRSSSPAVLDDVNEFGGFEQLVMSAGVKPGVGTAKPVDT